MNNLNNFLIKILIRLFCGMVLGINAILVFREQDPIFDIFCFILVISFLLGIWSFASLFEKHVQNNSGIASPINHEDEMKNKNLIRACMLISFVFFTYLVFHTQDVIMIVFSIFGAVCFLLGLELMIRQMKTGFTDRK